MRKIDFLGIIPARKGSKRLPNKNLVELNDVPLIGWTIRAAQNSSLISQTVVTSDSDEILNYSASQGIKLLHKRDDALATDQASSVDVVLDVLDKFSAEHIVLLQPTSPLRNSSHIDNAISFYKKNKNNTVSINKIKSNSESKFPISFNQSTQLVSLKNNTVERGNAYELNGAIYIISSKNLLSEKRFINKKTYGFLMHAKHSIDIDYFTDLEIAQNFIKELR